MVARGQLAIGLTRPVLARQAHGLKTMLLRKEPFFGVFPAGHRLARKRTVAWRDLADESLVILARREGVGLHDAILAACRRAHFTPKLSQTPSVIHTVLSYVEAGEGIGGASVRQGAARLEIRQQHRFVWTEDFGGLGHEVHAAEHDHLRIGGGGLAGQFQGIANEVRDVLDGGVLVVVRQDHGLALVLERSNGRR
jgi:DNA-binding transcriptional LysR family regulator